MWSRIRTLLSHNSLYLLLVVAITSGSLYFSQVFINRLKMEEHEKVLRIAGATKMITQNNNLSSDDLSFLVDIIENNHTVPLIVVNDSDEIVLFRNLSSMTEEGDSTKRFHLLKEMKQQYAPIQIEIDEETTNYIYYSNSNLIKNLRWFPYFQILLILGLLSLGYMAIVNKSKAEKNSLWVGMSRETAHQLGTPISSLHAWIELLKLEEADADIVSEIYKDVNRLEQIAKRFSTIGSLPKLTNEAIVPIMQEAVDYMKVRISKSIIFAEHFENINQNVSVPLNKTLFFWVIENLIKNAADAIVQKGTIDIRAKVTSQHVIIEVCDSGSGISKENQRKIFKTGYTSKERGWGLGLSLGKRIVDDYHKGQLLLKSSSNKGTTMRIVLRRDEKIV